MKAIITSLKSLCRTELPDSVCIDLAIASVGIEKKILKADSGNAAARKAMRHMAAVYLSSNKFGPVPAALRKFSSRELDKLSKGIADRNRPDGGRPPRPRRDKLEIAHWIYNEITQHRKSQNAACSDLAQKYANTLSPEANTPSPESFRKIYVEVLPDIRALYEEVKKIKATMIRVRCLD